MSVSAVAPTPFYQDPERLPIGLPPAPKGSIATDEAGTADDRRLSMFGAGDEEPSFWDLLDVVNPLQHIPVVGNLYREMTGDQIGVGARLVGGALFGGVIGLVASAVDCVVEESTGQDTGGHMLALFRDEHQSSPDTQLAQKPAEPAPSTVAATAAPVPPAAANAVSSSPAQAAATVPAPAAPVIALPDGKAPTATAAATATATATGQPMVFSLDGGQEMVAPAATPAAQPAVLAATTPPAAAGRPLQLRPTDGRMMPAPARSAAETKPVPQITVPVSNGMSRSNVPITGRAPQASSAFAAAPRAQVGQEGLAGHPMMPPTDANGQTAAAPDWFTTAWGQALDKYQRANQRNDKAAGGNGAPAADAAATLQ